MSLVWVFSIYRQNIYILISSGSKKILDKYVCLNPVRNLNLSLDWQVSTVWVCFFLGSSPPAGKSYARAFALLRKLATCAWCNMVERASSTRLSNCSVPENSLLFGVRRRAVFLGPGILFPTRQNRHAVLFAESFFWFLSSFYFFAEATFFLDHIQHCMVPLQPLHTRHLARLKVTGLPERSNGWRRHTWCGRRPT